MYIYIESVNPDTLLKLLPQNLHPSPASPTPPRPSATTPIASPLQAWSWSTVAQRAHAADRTSAAAPLCLRQSIKGFKRVSADFPS